MDASLHRCVAWCGVTRVSLLLGLITVAAFPVCAGSIQLSAEAQPFSSVRDYQISPDGQWVVYNQDATIDDDLELFSVPTAGGAPIRIGADEHADFWISPDSSRVVYLAYIPGSGYALHSVAIAGPATGYVEIAPPDDFGYLEIIISPDGSRVLYTTFDSTSSFFELYSVSILGPSGSAVRLNQTIATGGGGVLALGTRISPDGSRVVYLADQNTAHLEELYSVPIAGPASAGVALNLPMVMGESIWGDVEICPDSARVVYIAVRDGSVDLYSVPIVGPANSNVKLNRPMPGGGFMGNFSITPDGVRVAYSAQQDLVTALELYSVPIAGPSTSGTKLNPDFVAGREILSFEISNDGARVVYLADQDVGETRELYSVPVAGPAVSGVKLNGGLVTGGDVLDFKISPDSEWVVYRADQQIDDHPFGYRAPLAGPSGSDEGIWSAPDTSGPSTGEYDIDAAGRQVVIRGGWAWVDSVNRLWVCRLSAMPDFGGLILSDPPVANGEVRSFYLDSTGTRAVYRADQDIDEKFEIYSVTLPMLFADDFESGTTSSWSRTSG